MDKGSNRMSRDISGEEFVFGNIALTLFAFSAIGMIISFGGIAAVPMCIAGMTFICGFSYATVKKMKREENDKVEIMDNPRLKVVGSSE